MLLEEYTELVLCFWGWNKHRYFR